MTTPPPESSTPIVTPTPEETRAITSATLDEEIRALAQLLEKGGDQRVFLKGIVTAFDYSGSPPTVSIQVSGDTTTVIDGIRLLNNYAPQVGHTVIIGKQGSDIFVLGHLADLGATSTSGGAGGWVRATLSAGSHGGNSNGDVYYRRILDHGSWKMQWRGGWNVSGSFLINTAQALGTEFRPTAKRSVLVARAVTSAVAAQFDFRTDGLVELIGANTSPNSATTSGDVGSIGGLGGGTGSAGVSIGGTTGGASAGTAHTHGFSGGSSHSHGLTTNGHDHSFFGGSHSHSVSTPSWVSLNGCEYFL